MYETQMHPFILFPILISLAQNKNKSKKSPPSPPKLPILGNLHQLGSLPHQSLHALARKHGPMMLLRFGSVPVLIASSADAACEIMKTHDLTFAYRPEFKAFKKFIYGGKDVTLSPYGEYWRQMKSILVHQLLSSNRVQSFRSIREEETALFVKKIEESKRPSSMLQRGRGMIEVDRDGDNFIDNMLEMCSEKEVIAGSSVRESIKALLMDVIGGTETISTPLEWVMTELLREIIEDDRDITDDDIVKMHYLNAVIKETLRYHPPLPLLVPRRASKDVTIKERDRFLNSWIDFKGSDFELIPFGAGRRGCPGTTYAVVAMNCAEI